MTLGHRNYSSLSSSDDIDTPATPETGSQQSYKAWITYIIVSSVAFGIGNSSPPVSLLIYAHFVLLYLGYTRFAFLSMMHYIFCTVVTSVIGAVGFSYAFHHAFYTNDTFYVSYVMAFLVGFVYFILILTCCLSPHMYFSLRFPTSFYRYFIFPTLYCGISHLLYLNVGSFTSIAYSVSDFPSLRFSASLGGILVVEYFVLYVSTLLGCVIGKYDAQTSRVFMRSIAAIFVYFILLNVAMNQKTISAPYPSVSATCITAHKTAYHSTDFARLWNTTVLQASHSALIIWSEAATTLSLKDESIFLMDVRQLAVSTHTLIGVSYVLTRPSGVELNRFALVSARGDLNRKYTKAHAIPFLEKLYTSHSGIKISDTALGRIGVAIGHDYDFLNYIQNQPSVDIMLEPSSAWKGVARRHFDVSAMRALENGFTLFCCTSNGISGVVTHNGEVTSRIPSGHDRNVYWFTLPLQSHLSTLYKSVGYFLQYILYVVSGVIVALLLIPKGWIIRISQTTAVFPDHVVW